LCDVNVLFFLYGQAERRVSSRQSTFFKLYKKGTPQEKTGVLLAGAFRGEPVFFQKKLRLVSKRHSPQKFQCATDGAFRGNPTYEVCAMSNGTISDQNATARRYSNVVPPAHAKEIQDTRCVMLNGTISG